MILNSDILLAHPLWERADNELCGTQGISLFNRLVDVYLIACAIGVKADRVIADAYEPLASPKSIGRNTYLSMKNTDLRVALDYLLQNALINSETINVEVDERLRLAFDPDYFVKNLSAANFLTGFANYGIQEIFNHIDSTSPLVAVDELYNYFSELQDSDLDDLLELMTLDENVA